jgi:hypothetical protein
MCAECAPELERKLLEQRRRDGDLCGLTFRSKHDRLARCTRPRGHADNIGCAGDPEPELPGGLVVCCPAESPCERHVALGRPELERPTEPSAAFALEHSLREAADTLARIAFSGPGGATISPGEMAEVFYRELGYRVRRIAAHLPGSWRRIERELGDRAGEAFLLRTLEHPTGASLHVERDGRGRVSRAWIEPAPLLELPPRLPQND